MKFTWGEPETNWSGSYLYRVKLPDEETEVDSTRTNEVTVNAQPARTCLEVTAVRSDGKASPAKTACVDTPLGRLTRAVTRSRNGVRRVLPEKRGYWERSGVSPPAASPSPNHAPL